MKKILVLLVFGMLLACSQEKYDDGPVVFNPTGGETEKDGLAWYDVMEPFAYDKLSDEDSPGAGGTKISLTEGFNELEQDRNVSIALIEFDDKNNKVGMERSKVVEGGQDDIKGFTFDIKYSYLVRIKKGDITDEQFHAGMPGEPLPDGSYLYWFQSGACGFDFHDARNITIPFGTLLLELEIYDKDDTNLTNLLGTFHLVL